MGEALFTLTPGPVGRVRARAWGSEVGISRAEPGDQAASRLRPCHLCASPSRAHRAAGAQPGREEGRKVPGHSDPPPAQTSSSQLSVCESVGL